MCLNDIPHFIYNCTSKMYRQRKQIAKRIEKR